MDLVLGFHFILSAYGFWLPNDPRGSWSDCIRAFDLLCFGPATRVTTTRSLAAAPHDAALRRAAKQALRHKPVRFTGVQARAVARGIAIAALEARYVIHALAILPDHVHLVMAWHPKHVDLIAAHLKAKATHELVIAGMHPLACDASIKGRIPSPWARNHWCPFIRNVDHMREAIAYVERNLIKAGLRPQRWRQVQPYREMPEAADAHALA